MTHTNIERSELKVRKILEELVVTGRLLVLTISTGGIKDVVSLEANSLDNSISKILDGDFILLTN
jgi:hypothetical protein